MHILIDQNRPDDTIGNILTEGLIACDHLVYNRYGGHGYFGEDVDFVITTDSSSTGFLPQAILVHVGSAAPKNIPTIIHENPDAIYGILETYYNKTLFSKLPLEKRPVDICILADEDNPYCLFILRKFPYNNIEIISHPEKETATTILSKSKVVVVPKSRESHKSFIWRALASGGLIMIEDRGSYTMFPPLKDKHCITFTEETVLKRELELSLTYPLQQQHVADAAFNTGRRYYTSRIRGRQFVTYLLAKTANVVLLQQNMK